MIPFRENFCSCRWPAYSYPSSTVGNVDLRATFEETQSVALTDCDVFDLPTLRSSALSWFSLVESLLLVSQNRSQSDHVV